MLPILLIIVVSFSLASVVALATFGVGCGFGCGDVLLNAAVLLVAITEGAVEVEVVVVVDAAVVVVVNFSFSFVTLTGSSVGNFS